MLNFLSTFFGFIVAPRDDAYTAGTSGDGPVSSIGTVRWSTSVAPLTCEYQFWAEEDLMSGDSSRSVVHLTSSAVTGEPSLNFAFGSSWNVQLKPSLACSHEAASDGTTASLSSKAVSDS